MVRLYGRLPERKARFGYDGQADCSFVSGLVLYPAYLCGAFCPLALMGSADPRLICSCGLYAPQPTMQAWRIAV